MNLLLDLLVPCLVQLTLPLHWYCIGHRGVGDIYFVGLYRTYVRDGIMFFFHYRIFFIIQACRHVCPGVSAFLIGVRQCWRFRPRLSRTIGDIGDPFPALAVIYRQQARRKAIDWIVPNQLSIHRIAIDHLNPLTVNKRHNEAHFGVPGSPRLASCFLPSWWISARFGSQFARADVSLSHCRYLLSARRCHGRLRQSTFPQAHPGRQRGHHCPGFLRDVSRARNVRGHRRMVFGCLR